MKAYLNILVIFSIIMILPYGAVWADQTNYAIGKVGGAELKIGLGARPVGMGEAFVAQADDVNSTAWNAAGLAQIQGHQVGLMHTLYLQDTSLEYVAYAQNIFTGAGVGVNVMYLNYGSMEKLDEVDGLPVANGSFTPAALAATVGFGQWLLPELAMGGAVKMIQQSIDTERYTAVAVDLGGLYQTPLSGLRLGLAVQNLGTALGGADLPRNIKAGAAYALPFTVTADDAWQLLLDVNVPLGDASYTSLNLGTEYWYNHLVAARAGYQLKNNGAVEGLSGLTVGAGVKVAMAQVDYALVAFGDLGMTHQLALSVGF